MEHYQALDIGEFINIGTGNDVTISELADLVARTIGYTGEVR